MSNRPRARKTFSGGSGGFSGSHSAGHSGGGGFGGGGSHSGGFSFGSGGRRSSGGSRGPGGCLIPIIIIIVMIFGGGGLTLNNMLGGSDYQEYLQGSNGTSSGWYDGASNSGKLNTEVSSAARDKFTLIKGNDNDKVTIMAYMCGTDLESQYAAATKDLNEMLKATTNNDNMNIIVYTGGCKRWQNKIVSSKYNQIYQIRNGKFIRLEKNAGNASMTKASTLSSFIKWTAERYPANRTDLIFWDHGGGSASGYGYDEKYPSSGSMTLSAINTALEDADIKFDFIGFDACLMATAETAYMLGNYADYLIGSEETEPGIGWYYTNWLSDLSADTSQPTIETGKTIADDFTSECANSCPGQSTTLSVVDLAELSQTMPAKLEAFADNTSKMISDNKYKELAAARSSSKEFARGNKLDQIDLVHFARLVDSGAASDLADTLLEAIKYNKTSSNTANAYGLSVYFPGRDLSKVDTMTRTYEDIGLSDEYSDCVQKFAQMEVSGQAVAGGSSSPFGNLNGSSGSSGWGSSSGSATMDQDAIAQLLGSLLSSSFSDYRSLNIDGLDRSNTHFLREGPLTATEASEYIADNQFDSEDLRWTVNDDGDKVVSLSEDQWDLVETIDQEMYYDDNGDGYYALGLDNVFDFDDDGNMLPNMEKTWIALDGQVVAYYHTETLERGGDSYVITGYVPVKLNGRDARLILSFDEENEQGYVAGVSFDYSEKITSTAAKTMTGLKKGDKLKFMCEYYNESGDLEGTYEIGRGLTVRDPADIEITNESLGSGHAMMFYKFTDIYGKEYWTPSLSN